MGYYQYIFQHFTYYLTSYPPEDVHQWHPETPPETPRISPDFGVVVRPAPSHTRPTGNFTKHVNVQYMFGQQNFDVQPV